MCIFWCRGRGLLSFSKTREMIGAKEALVGTVKDVDHFTSTCHISFISLLSEIVFIRGIFAWHWYFTKHRKRCAYFPVHSIIVSATSLFLSKTYFCDTIFIYTFARQPISTPHNMQGPAWKPRKNLTVVTSYNRIILVSSNIQPDTISACRFCPSPSRFPRPCSHASSSSLIRGRARPGHRPRRGDLTRADPIAPRTKNNPVIK